MNEDNLTFNIMQLVFGYTKETDLAAKIEEVKTVKRELFPYVGQASDPDGS